MDHRPRKPKNLTLEDLFTLPDAPVSKPFYKYSSGEDLIQVHNDSFTIVLSREVRKNARIAAEMALAIAREDERKDVWYINTYAGINLLKEAFSDAMSKANIPMPKPEKRSEEEAKEKREEPAEVLRKAKLRVYTSSEGNKWVEGEGEDAGKWFRLTETSEDSASENFTSKDSASADSSSSETEASDKPKHILPNLHVFDVPIGQWSTNAVGIQIRDYGKKGNKLVVIINSFEFAPISRSRKEMMARELLELRDSLGLTVVIFSHEMKRDLEAGVPGRGAIGIIAAHAESVWRLKDPFEHLIRSRGSKNDTIHEAQTRVNKLLPTSEGGVEELGDYHQDPWKGSDTRTGRELAPLARTPLLKQWYLDHLDDEIMRGYQPTEWGLQRREEMRIRARMERDGVLV